MTGPLAVAGTFAADVRWATAAAAVALAFVGLAWRKWVTRGLPSGWTVRQHRQNIRNDPHYQRLEAEQRARRRGSR